MDSKWILSELAQPVGSALWRASWAESDPHNALVHHYFFEAPNVEAAHTKIFGWINMPAHALPVNARIVKENWHSPYALGCALPIWRVTWLEDREKHALFLFEPSDHAGAALRARHWARNRAENLENFQALTLLGGVQRYQAMFDPEEGRAIFAL